MIYIKLYENFDFNEDDFDIEEEQPNENLKVGDKVKPKNNYYYRSISRNNICKNLLFTKSDQLKGTFIVVEIINYDNKKIMIIRNKNDILWPWYDCEYWKKIK